MSVALTNSLNYMPKAEAPSCTAYRYSTNSNAASYSPTQVIQIDIPCGQGQNVFLDTSNSYLKFTLNANVVVAGVGNIGTTAATYNNVAVAQLDGSAMALFQQLDVYSQSNLIETIQDYNVLSNILLTYTVGANARQTQWSVQAGTSGFSCGNVGALPYGGNTAGNIQAASSVTQWRQGEQIWFCNLTGANVAVGGYVTVTRTYCIPLIGMLGVNLDKYLPCGSLASDIRLEMTLANTYVPFTGAVTTGNEGELSTLGFEISSWNVTNVQYCGQIIKISPEALNIVHQSNPLYPNVMINYSTFRNYTASVATGASTATLLFGARFASLKSLYCVIRDQSIITGNQTGNCASTSCFTAGPLYSYYWTIGTQLYPPQPIYMSSNSSAGNTTCMWFGQGNEAICETLKAFHALNAGWNQSSGVDKVQFQFNPMCDTYYGWNSAFCMGIELESFANKNEILSGINTQNQNVFLNLQWSSTIAPSYQVDCFAHFDSHLLIQQGVMSARF